jgi:integrase/recombinase XerC
MEISNLRSFYRWAEEEQAIKVNPMVGWARRRRLVEPLLDAHLRWCLIVGKRPGTIEQRRFILGRFEGVLGLRLEDATRDDIGTFLEIPTIGQTTRRSYLGHLRQFYAWAVNFDHLSVNPTIGWTRPPAIRGVPRPIGESDLKTALERARRPARTWLLVSAYAGLRSHEIAAMSRADIDIENGRLLVPDGKGGHSRWVPLIDRLVDEFDEAELPGHGWLWPGRPDARRHITPGHVSRRAAQSMRSAGVDCTLHQLRHRFGSAVYRESGHDLRMTQELLGHASPVTTAIYTLVDMTAARSVVERLASS